MNAWKRLQQVFFSSADNGLESTSEACFWQADMHSHLVPGIDDGVHDSGQALACLQQLSDWGLKRIITTPHVSRDWYPNDTATLQEGKMSLQTLVDANNLPIRVDVAAEYMIDEFFPRLLDTDDLLSFGVERYLLIEIGWVAPPQQFEAILFRMQTRGYIPVLAHPERYTYYFGDEEALSRLRNAGCLFQLNWLSLVGRYGEKVRTQARLLLKNKWVDFIGSDLHRPNDLSALGSLFVLPDYELLRAQPLRNASLLTT